MQNLPLLYSFGASRSRRGANAGSVGANEAGTARNGQQLDGFFLGSRRPPQQVRQDCACRAKSYTCIMRGTSDKARIHPVFGLPAVVGIEYRAWVSSGANTNGSTL